MAVHQAPAASEAQDIGEVTILLRNIACKYTQDDVKRILEEYGFRGTFSYISVPRKTRSNSNLGYAFIRFRTEQYALECCRACGGKKFGPAATMKKCFMEVSTSQGSAGEVAQQRQEQCGESQILICNDPLPPAEASAAPAPHEGTVASQGPPRWPPQAAWAAHPPSKVAPVGRSGLGAKAQVATKSDITGAHLASGYEFAPSRGVGLLDYDMYAKLMADDSIAGGPGTVIRPYLATAPATRIAPCYRAPQYCPPDAQDTRLKGARRMVWSAADPLDDIDHTAHLISPGMAPFSGSRGGVLAALVPPYEGLAWPISV